jgi:hypothetical protein
MKAVLNQTTSIGSTINLKCVAREINYLRAIFHHKAKTIWRINLKKAGLFYHKVKRPSE